MPASCTLKAFGASSAPGRHIQEQHAMPQERNPDVVIRSRLSASGTQFIVVCGSSERILGGPFTGMTEAVGFAVAQATAAQTRILYEAHDERGRTIGERLLLRTAT
jgi:hypothetical protein